MERKGTLIYWEISEFKTGKKDLLALGIPKDVLPRNDAKAALIKGLRIVTKCDDRFYKKFADGKHEVRFAVVNPDIVINESDGDVDIDFNKELTISLEKSSGLATRTRIPDDDSELHQEFFNRILTTYQEERGTIDSMQFRLVVSRLIREYAYGIPMRSRGGIYFIDDRKSDDLDLLRRVFTNFKENCKMYEVPVYRDGESLVALEDATQQSISREIEELLDGLRDGKITRRILLNRHEEVESLIERVKFHESTLRGSAETLSDRLTKVDKIIDRLKDGEKMYSFMDELGSL